jgi:hypothetical protein
VTNDERAREDFETLYDLAAEVIHGTASEIQFVRLEEELRSNPEARSAYLHYALLHAQLNLTDAALIARAVVPGRIDSPTRAEAPGAAAGPAAGMRARLVKPFTLIKGLGPRAGRAARDRPWLPWTVAAAACLCSLLVGALAARRRPEGMPPRPERRSVAMQGRGEPADGDRHGHAPAPPGRARSARHGRGDGGVASLVEARNLVWAEGQAPIGANTRLKPQDIRWLAGTLKLAFDSGALVTLEGPADLQVLSSMRIRAARGRITAHVDGGAKGFSIETPSTVVVDQGTEFGLEVDASGQTGVVVFRGLVDLCPGSARSPAPIRRLGQGEGMRIGRTGLMSRIVSVERRPDVDAWSIGPSADRDAVIRSVRDNIRDLGSSKYYEIVHRGLADGMPTYVDRLYQWKGLGPGGLPGFLRGADYIMPFNDDKWAKDLQITVELGPAATLYIFYDDRQAIPPWLAERFTDTGVDIGLDVSVSPTWHRNIRTFPFSVWKRDLERGETISLGAIELGAIEAMYGIAAVPRP